jgi:hypothetical protein
MPEGVLGTLSEESLLRLSAQGARLERLAVEVRLRQRVLEHSLLWICVIAGRGAHREPDRDLDRKASLTIAARQWLNATRDKAGQRSCRARPVRARPSGKSSSSATPPSLDQDGKTIYGRCVAKCAMQQGRYVGSVAAQASWLESLIRGRLRYFGQRQHGMSLGTGFAILQSGKLRMSGFVAWLAWAAIHLEFLTQANLRVSVLLQWVWTYITAREGRGSS